LRFYQGNGDATEAALATVQAAAATGRRRLWTVRPRNDASFGVLEKVGFVRTDRITTDDFGESIWCRFEL
jgi:RimJ/RimL family protein N-acetyltransferase